MKASRMSEKDVRQALEELPGWSLLGGKLHRELSFGDFVTAFGWMTVVAMAAEKMSHHPDWSNSWSTVTVDLWTHEAEGITEKDIKLAKRMSALAECVGGR